jgi:uncharacterized protein DUF4476/PDZ domain-containing protein
MRTSVLAMFCFLSGLLSACAVSVAWFLAYLAGLGEMADLRGDDAAMLLLAARIVTGAAVAPAAVAVAFWLGARGAVREANGALLGRGLYRAGVLLAVGSVVCAFGGRWSVSGKIQSVGEEMGLSPQEQLRRARSGRHAVSPQAQDLLRSLRRMSFDDDRAAALKTGDGTLTPADLAAILGTFVWDKGRMEAMHACVPSRVAMRFTADEVLALCGEFTHDEDRLKMLEIVAPGLVDKDAAHRIVGAFTFQDGKGRAGRIIEEKGGTDVAPEGQGWLGATLVAEGAQMRITAMSPGGPADRSELSVGCFILGPDAESVSSFESFIRRTAPGTLLELKTSTYERANRNIIVRLGRRSLSGETDLVSDGSIARWGVTGTTRRGADGLARGVLVSRVAADSAAERIGVKPEDVILSVGGVSVSCLLMLEERFKSAPTDAPVRVQRGIGDPIELTADQ